MQTRIAAVRAAMARHGLNQLIVSAPAAVFYLTGVAIEPGERLLALALAADGASHLFVNRLFPTAAPEGIALHVHGDGQDATADIAQVLQPGPVGVDKFWPSAFLIRLLAKKPGLIPVEGSLPVDETRMVKDAGERERLRAASRLNDRVTAQAIAAISPEKDELALAREVLDAYASAGMVSWSPLVCYGAGCAEPHHSPDHTRLKPGDSVILDIGGALDGYQSDMTRTVFYREASPLAREVYQVVLEAHEAGIAAVKPGRPLREVDAAARSIIERAGYGAYFTHRLGHNLGLEVHEYPDVSAASEAICQEGMCFSIEPGVYLPGQFGVRIEDLVLVGPQGAEDLNALDKSLRIVG